MITFTKKSHTRSRRCHELRKKYPCAQAFRREKTEHSLARFLALGLAFFVLFGCGVFQPGAAPGPGAVPGQAAISPTVSPAIPLTFTAAPAAIPSATPSPFLSATPVPSLTPFPSLTPVFDVSKYTPSATATPVSPYFGRCCTLRVRNGGSIPLWIGEQLPRPGNTGKPRWFGRVIEPRHYLEFYPAQPKIMTVYWCLWVNRTKVPDEDLLGAPAPGSDNLFDCRHREVNVREGLIEIYVQ